jgi:hypothetical protein
VCLWISVVKDVLKAFKFSYDNGHYEHLSLSRTHWTTAAAAADSDVAAAADADNNHAVLLLFVHTYPYPHLPPRPHIRADLLSLEAFGDASLHEDNMFRDSSRRATLMADVLSALHTNMSADSSDATSNANACAKIQSMYKTANLDVLKYVFPQGPKMTQAQAETEFLGKYAKLTFLGGGDASTEGLQA